MERIDRIVFFGTPEFAVPTLEALCAAGRRPRLVVSQPARPVGRGWEIRQPPVAQVAAGHGLVLVQPQRLADDPFRDRLAQLAPDLIVVVAYGRIFPSWLLSLPRLGCINLHASLLPRWRGAAPIQAALTAGDQETGVTTMQMSKGLDAGPLLLQRRVAIAAGETAGELAPRLAREGADLVVETVARLERVEITPRPQEEAEATYAPRLRRDDGRADWRLPAVTLFNRWRAFTPWPGLSATLREQPVKLIEVETGAGTTTRTAGEIVAIDAAAVEVACGESSVLRLLALQRAGRRIQPAAVFARGERLAVADRFD